jgi:acetyl-CoA decarbonylase/synthase complex subunit epsilon
MATVEPWQTAEVPGPQKALVITKPEVVATMIKKAKRPLLIVGHEAVDIDLGDKKLIDYMITLAKEADIPVLATAHIVKNFLEREYKPAAWMPVVDIGNRLVDAEWTGICGEGQHDLALFVGLPYYMEWTVLSGLKHFAPKVKTITLDNVYHPHASWSFPNMSVKDWVKNLKGIIAKFEKKEEK